MPTAGKKPGMGRYKCRKCGKVVVLGDKSDALPPCPRCCRTKFAKLG